MLLVTAGFLLYAESGLRRGSHSEQVFRATFTSSVGLAVASDVTVAGVPVGRVLSIRLDPATMLSRVVFTIRADIALPADSTLAVEAAGMSGADVLSVRPGTSHDRLASGGTVRRTVPALGLEQAAGEYIFGAGGLSEPP